MTTHLRLEVGPAESPTDLLGDVYSITNTRGLDLDGVSDEPTPATFTATIKGSTTANPLTNADVRPDRPIRFLAGIEDTYGSGVTWHTIWTGKILKGRIEHNGNAKHDPNAYTVQITATDIVRNLAAVPALTAVSGTLAQRVATAIPAGIPYVVTDNEPPTATAALPTDQKTVLGQLRLIRDTLHAAMFVDKAGVLQLVADNSRLRRGTAADFVATDEDPAPDGAILYHDLGEAFDSDTVVNVLTVKVLTDTDPVETTYTDEDSRDAWGPHAQTVTVNDGLAETHAGLYLATRTDPDLTPERIEFVIDSREDTYAAHLAAACAIEINDTIDVDRLGRTHRLGVRELTHTVTVALEPVPRLRWTVAVGLRIPDVLATRWNDIPAGIRWDDVPAGVTWNNSLTDWHPYL